jgi:ABC-type polar amino acid transport system ATPase subunit
MSLCIKVEGLSKYFKDHAVIQDLTLSVEEGEIVVFQGPSGVGKSTFLRCLTYLEPFQKGVVRVGDILIHPGMDERKERRTLQSLHQQLGFVFQFFNLFPHLTVLENLTLGPMKVLGREPETARKEALGLLTRVGLESKAGAYPRSLSGGQQQRVGIARALAMNPKAILFDEPTSSLDPEMKEEIVEVMEDFAQDGLTMLIVTHEPAFVERIATRVIKFGPCCSVVSDQKTRVLPKRRAEGQI